MRGPAATSSGFSLLELVIVVCIVAVLATLATERLMTMRAQAERVGMETMLGSLRSTLGIQVAEAIARKHAEQVAKLESSNPIDKLSEIPDNYRGSFFGLNPALVEGGQWYFDSRDHTLVYRVQFGEYFETGLDGPPRARFKVRLVFEDINRNQRFDSGVDKPTGLRLQAVEPFRWLDTPRSQP